MASCLRDTAFDAARSSRLGFQRGIGHGRAGHAVAVLERAQASNTTFDATLAAKNVGPKPTVFIAGDDTVAEAALADLITAGGVLAIDAGSFARAHELEAIGFLQLTSPPRRSSWTGGFGVVT